MNVLHISFLSCNKLYNRCDRQFVLQIQRDIASAAEPSKIISRLVFSTPKDLGCFVVVISIALMEPSAAALMASTPAMAPEGMYTLVLDLST